MDTLKTDEYSQLLCRPELPKKRPKRWWPWFSWVIHGSSMGHPCTFLQIFRISGDDFISSSCCAAPQIIRTWRFGHRRVTRVWCDLNGTHGQNMSRLGKVEFWTCSFVRYSPDGIGICFNLLAVLYSGYPHCGFDADLLVVGWSHPVATLEHSKLDGFRPDLGILSAQKYDKCWREPAAVAFLLLAFSGFSGLFCVCAPFWCFQISYFVRHG